MLVVLWLIKKVDPKVRRAFQKVVTHMGDFCSQMGLQRRSAKICRIGMADTMTKLKKCQGKK